jgi:diguanylate cyclase (GGDEF)-like protein
MISAVITNLFIGCLLKLLIPHQRCCQRDKSPLTGGSQILPFLLEASLKSKPQCSLSFGKQGMTLLSLGLKQRIYTGFAALVLLAVALVSVAAWQLSAIKTEVERLGAISANAARALELSNQIQIIRRANLGFMLDGDRAAMDDATAAEARSVELLKASFAAARSEVRRNFYNSLKLDVDSLRAKRETLASLVAQEQAARAELFSGGEELAANADRLSASRSSISDPDVRALAVPIGTDVLLVRVANWRFQATRDPSGPATFKANVENAQAAIAAFEKADLPDAVRALIGPVTAALSSYISNFELFSANVLKRDDVFWKDMVPLTDVVLDKIFKAEAAFKRAAEATDTQTHDSIAATITGQEMIAGSALLLGGLIAYFVARSIIKPITGMTKAMGELADGNFDIVLPGLGSKDEIGQMAQRVEDFKVKAVDKARLEAEELRAREANLQAQNVRFDAALSNMSQGLVLFEADERLVICNQRYVQMYRLQSDFVRPGCTLRELIDMRIANGSFSGDPDQYIDNLRAAMRAGAPTNQFVQLDDGRTIAEANQPMAGGGWVATHQDITEQRRAAAKISHMALHDALTNLPNRLFFREQIENRLAQIDRDRKFAVLCLDLDDFKSVNDTLGHPFGDILLRQVGERLRGCLREGDSVARLGGDEFVLLQGSVTQPTDTTSLMTRIIAAISAPFDLEGQQVVIGVSIGVAVAPTDATGSDQLLKSADQALYRAKVDGRGTYRFFEPEMDARMQARRTLELDLRRALINGEFEVYYQPLVNMKTELICGFEALIRWNHPERGIILPAEFIPLAEETALIVPIGEWVLRQACEEAAKWPSEIYIAANLSSAQFKTPGLFQIVFNALAQSGLAADRLELEITETVLLFNSKSTLETLHRLRALGVRISMDDFGTGYSSLSYLRSFPFNKIKIDQSFVRDLSTNKDSMAIIRAVVGLGNSLGMVTTGEGVESQEERYYLKREGCTEAQGYLFGRAQPAKEAATLLAKQAANIKAVA